MNIVGYRLWFFVLAAALFLISVVSLVVFRLNPGIDFAAGSQLTLKFEQTVPLNDVKDIVATMGYTAQVEFDAHGNVIIRTPEITAEQKAALKSELSTQFGPLTELGFESIDPLVAQQTVRAAIIAMVAASVVILLYIAFAFRKMPNPFNYGLAAVVALVLDCVVVLGVFSILGKVAGWEIDLALVTGILTVIGYAVNDTIVVFDRIRETQKRNPSVDFAKVVNNSLMDTMTRSLVTGVGVLFVLVALLLVVGPTIKNLVVVLMVGIYFGTFTSLFVASPLLVVLHKKQWGTFFPKNETAKKLA